MNREQIVNTVGLAAGVGLVAVLVGSYFLQRPPTDRLLVAFAALLWATLQLDISPALPISIITQTGRSEGEDGNGE